MVFQKALESAKDKPKDEKKAIAGGIAIAVVLVLLVGWAFFFFRNIQRGAYDQQLGGGAQDEFNFSTVRDAQSELMKQFDDVDALIEAQRASSRAYEPAPQGEQYDTPDPFGGYNSLE
jgi:hypothetical protein